MQNAKPAFASGYGQSDTRALILSDGRPNPHPSAGKRYTSVTGAEVVAMANNPASVAKDKAQWFIPSTYIDCDARTHDVQRVQGNFRWLTLDVDNNNLTLADVDATVSDVIGEACRLIYSTRSATKDNQKWRVLIPTANAIAGADFSDTQNAFFDLLENASAGALIPDRKLAGPAQLVYLPNRGAFYEVKAKKAGLLDLTPAHAIIQHRNDRREQLAKVDAEAKSARDKRAAKRNANAQLRGLSSVDHFNSAHTVSDLLARYGYVQAGSSCEWRSPMQSSGSYATRDCGDYWVSLSDSDANAEIGALSKGGHRYGDAFDLFTHFEHDGNFKKAVAAYGAEIKLSRLEDLSDFPKVVKPVPTAADLLPIKGQGPSYVVSGTGTVLWCIENACQILEHDEAWAGLFAYDEEAALNLLLKPIPETKTPKSSFRPRPIKEADLTAVQRWFNRNGFPRATANVVIEAVYATAAANVIAPVRHYLEALSWDGVKRLDKWLTTYGGADDKDITCRMGRAWMISAVARALQPGCKVDCALILEGVQGAHKSSAAKLLAGAQWFSDSLGDMHTKDASAALRGRWIIELPELSAMRRSDTEAIKAFMSRSEERFRPAYGRTEVVEPRRCVFIGTTNRSDYLMDDTGNRRFWPVKIKKFDLDKLTTDRDQLWAEAVAAYRMGEKWWLDHADEIAATGVANARRADDPWESVVLNAVIGKTHTGTAEILTVIGVSVERRTRSDNMRVAGILERAGWVNNGKYTSGTHRGSTRFLSPHGRADFQA